MKKIRLPKEFFDELRASINKYLPTASFQTIMAKLKSKYGKEVAEKINKLLDKEGITASDLTSKFESIFEVEEFLAVSFTAKEQTERILNQIKGA